MRPVRWFVFGLLGSWTVWNSMVTVPAAIALYNGGAATLLVYRSSLLSASNIVVDLQATGSDISIEAVDQSLFRVAQALRACHFQTVILAAGGVPRLVLDGDRFWTLGQHMASGDTSLVAADLLTLSDAIRVFDSMPLEQSHATSPPQSLNEMMARHVTVHSQWWGAAWTRNGFVPVTHLATQPWPRMRAG